MHYSVRLHVNSLGSAGFSKPFMTHTQFNKFMFVRFSSLLNCYLNGNCIGYRRGSSDAGSIIINKKLPGVYARVEHNLYLS